jgi:hypothetical protein
MPTACISWDLQRVFAIETGDASIMGRAFDLLPGGTMFSASCIQRGIVGVKVKMLSATRAEIIDFHPVIIPRSDTKADELEHWRDELLESFHALPSD